MSKTFHYCGMEQQYTVPYTGIYVLTAEGAQGGNYETFGGGYGGRVSVRVWLSKGEVLYVTVGGQNGYNGGGSASTYGCGGGYTMISGNRKGVLLIAGGGGGASPDGDGKSGGSAASNITGNDGQSGFAGGGGGYQGGTAGEHILHHHVSGTCPYHTHTGNAKEGGGCYQKPVETTGTCKYVDKGTRTDQSCGMVHCQICKGKSLGTNHCHWYGHSACGGEGGHKGYQTCAKGHVTQRWGSFKTGTHPYPILTYELCCGMEEGWSCQYEEGQVISSRPAYGGSNYVNGEHAFSQSSEGGVRAGDGLVTIRSESIGFVDAISLSGVIASDCAAPNQVENVQVNPVSARQIEIAWEEPSDAGTAYYHYVESCLRGSSNPLCRSNIEKNTLISGVKGYYLLVNGDSRTMVTTQNAEFQEDSCKVVTLSTQRQYLHVAAVDVAGNIGVTRHIPFGADEDVVWKLYTRPFKITEGENVHAAQQKGTFYVRSDGNTPFQLQSDSYMDGTASMDYQINYSVYESVADEAGTQITGGRNVIKTQSMTIRDGEIRSEASALEYSVEQAPILSIYPYSYTVRKNRNRELTSIQQFTLESGASGKRIKITPMAGADRDGEVVWSDRRQDERNSIILIGDGEAPVIRGLEVLSDKELINRPDGTIMLDISAEDNLSGIGELYVKITNLDNGVEETYELDESGRIYINITKDEPIFSGDFIVEVHASDNVGNESEMTTATTEFALSASVERMLEPHDPIFKCGESGILTITTWGYAERVEVEFPPEMADLHPELNKVFDYTQMPEYVKEEKVQFMVPLDTPENEKYTITVRAYKGDKRLEDHPSLSTVAVEGSILEELRTRLR